VKNSNRRDVKNFVSNLTDAVKTYQKFITTTEDSDTPSNSVESQKKQKINNNRKLNTSKDKDLIDSFFIGGTDEENNWKNFVNSFTKTDNEIEEKTLSTILDAFRSEDTTISLTKNINIRLKMLKILLVIQNF
jgi:hypothetical protein